MNLFDEHPACKRIAGQVIVQPLDGRWNGYSLYDSIFHLQQTDYVKKGYCVTANLAVRKSVFDAVGGFSEEAFSGGDKQWNLRATSAGVPIQYDREMSVLHPARETLGECAKKRRRIAGAWFYSDPNRPFRKKMPRLRRIFPSLRACTKIWRSPHPVGVGTRLGAMWCHYAVGLAYNVELARLLISGGTPNRS